MTHRSPAAVVMGVAGCGKTEVGAALAARLDWTFIEGDRLHPAENVARMSRGEPLNDDHRVGWLDAIGRAMAEGNSAGQPAVAACSALKRIYRDRLRGFVPGASFVFLDIDREESRRRVGGRTDHFMPASLVDSQFAILEPPAADELAIRLDGTLPINELAARAAAFLREA